MKHYESVNVSIFLYVVSSRVSFTISSVKMETMALEISIASSIIEVAGIAA